MSTKTSIKRVALIAVSALGFGLMSVIPASAGTVTATVGPVRVSFTDGVRDTVAAAAFTVTPDANVAAGVNNDTLFTLTQAPTSTAEVTIILNGHTVKDTLGGSATEITNTTFTGSYASGTAVTGSIALTSAPVAGTYKGTVTLRANATSDVVVNFSFTTTGKVATIKTDAEKYEMPALAQTDANNFLSFKKVSVTLVDQGGNTTQAATGDSITTSIASNTHIDTKVTAQGAASANLTFTDSDLNDGAHDFLVGSVTTTADTEVVTLTPAGIMPAQGVVAKTFTATTAAASGFTNLATTLASPTATSVVKAVTGTPKSYNTDPVVATFGFAVAGLEAGKGYRIYVVSNGTGAQTAEDDQLNSTPATLNDNGTTAVQLFGIVPASGTVNVTVKGAIATTEFIKVSANDADFDDAVDAVVTSATPAYAVTVSTPAVTPTMTTTSAVVTVAGKVADQYGNPLAGATVALAGTSTPAGSNRTASGITSTTGEWSIALPAAAATTTQLSIVATAIKPGALNAPGVSANAVVVTFTATGTPDTMTFANVAADSQDPAAATTAPQVRPMHDGTATSATDEQTTISTGATATGVLDAADELARFTPTTTPGSQVVVTASADVLLFTATGGTVADGKSTVTVASGGDVYAAGKTVGKHTVTFTAGTLSKTWSFYVTDSGQTNQGEVVRNLTPSVTTLDLNGGEYSIVTVKATDVFGNAIKSAVALGGVSVLVKASGAVLLDGPALSRTFTTTDADGNITFGVIAGQSAGTGTITIEGTGAQLGAAAGAVTGTTAGTNGFAASSNKATITIKVTGNAQDSTEAALEATEAANQAYEAAVVATETAEAAVAAAEDAKAAADAATAAVEALATQVSTMMAELKAQVTKLAKTVAKILKRV